MYDLKGILDSFHLSVILYDSTHMSRGFTCCRTKVKTTKTTSKINLGFAGIDTDNKGYIYFYISVLVNVAGNETSIVPKANNLQKYPLLETIEFVLEK